MGIDIQKCLLIHSKFSSHSFYNFSDVARFVGARYPAAPLGLMRRPDRRRPSTGGGNEAQVVILELGHLRGRGLGLADEGRLLQRFATALAHAPITSGR